MTIKTAIRLSFVIAIGAMIVTATSIGAAFEATPESKLFSPQPSGGVPTIISDVSCYTFYTPSNPQNIQQDHINTCTVTRYLPTYPSAVDILESNFTATANWDVNCSDSTLQISYEDAQILMAIAQAEAEIDGVEGMMAVMKTIINRVNDARFPNTVKEVVMQEAQFSPISDGRYYTMIPTAKVHLALAGLEKGVLNQFDALYFENAENSWQEKNCTYVATIGHHRFYK